VKCFVVLVLASVTAGCLIAPGETVATHNGVYHQSFCGMLRAPGHGCSSSGLHSFDSSTSWYPGPPAHHVKTCTYLYNARTNQVRGGWTDCRWSDVGQGQALVVFGPTTQPDYYARAFNHIDTCCAHTIKGYAETTY
jgi:hypothetical protein